jgi:hypothetical protein
MESRNEFFLIFFIFFGLIYFISPRNILIRKIYGKHIHVDCMLYGHPRTKPARNCFFRQLVYKRMCVHMKQLPGSCGEQRTAVDDNNVELFND